MCILDFMYYYYIFYQNKIPQKQKIKMQKIIKCGDCNQTINAYETYIEFDDIFYHEKCYACQYCSVSFKTDNLLESIPLKDKFNRLVCVKDFIR